MLFFDLSYLFSKSKVLWKFLCIFVILLNLVCDNLHLNVVLLSTKTRNNMNECYPKKKLYILFNVDNYPYITLKDEQLCIVIKNKKKAKRKDNL